MTQLTFNCYAVIPGLVVAGPGGEGKNLKRAATRGFKVDDEGW